MKTPTRARSYSGRHSEAIRLVRRGLSKIDPFEEPRLLVSARHNLIGYLNESGRHEEALRTLEETRGLYLQLGERSHLVRLRWLEGRIQRDLDEKKRYADLFLRQCFSHWFCRLWEA